MATAALRSSRADAPTDAAPAPELPKRQTLRGARASKAQADRQPARKASERVFAALQAVASNLKVHVVDHSWCSYHNLVLMLAQFTRSDVCVTDLSFATRRGTVQTTRCAAQDGSPALSGKDSLNLRPLVHFTPSRRPQ